MSYRLNIDPKSRKAARFISRLQKEIQKALIDSGKTQQEIATILDVDRSVINRRLRGNANLTARSIAEFAYALDKDIVLEFVDGIPVDRSNTANASSNILDLQEFKGNTTTGTVRPQSTFSLESAAS